MKLTVNSHSEPLPRMHSHSLNLKTTSFVYKSANERLSDAYTVNTHGKNDILQLRIYWLVIKQ